MDMELKETAEKYLFSDYESWDDDNRYELIDGKVYLMSPAPSIEHQAISGEVFSQLRNFLRGKPCMAFMAPVDVCLNGKGDGDDTIVQPDVLVLCDKSKLDKKRVNGAPDMVVEILSPSSASRDSILKMNKYLNAGVREYWIVDPESKKVYTNLLSNGKYILEVYTETDTVPVGILEGCQIDMKEAFKDLWAE
jgi:Uma2 family endonuclease